VRWLELASRVDGEAVEAVSEIFSRVASAGVAVEPDLIPGADDGFVTGSNATVRAYIPLDSSAPTKTALVAESLWHLRVIWPVGELETHEIADEEWAHAWKAHYSTFRIGRRLVIRPSWLRYEPLPDDVVVMIDPGVAFGTGLHPTTRCCLEVLENEIQPGDRVLDVGTGSGILSLAAIGLGASEVLAVDLDSVAVDAARSNVELNHLSDCILVAEGSVDVVEGRQFDVVIANIIARVILELAPSLLARTRPGGTLVLAGIFADRTAEVQAAFARLGVFVETFLDGDWVALVGRVPPVR
jgi:ribosomal protein L11 methyltransferase